MAKSKSSQISISAREARKASQNFSRIHGETPIVPLEEIERDGVKLNIYGKLENVQSVFTFKARGAEHFVYLLMDQYHNKRGMFRNVEKKPELVTASAGNHAQGLALAANRYGLYAVIFVPEETPEVKLNRVKELGGNIEVQGIIFDESLEAALQYSKGKQNRIFVPPFESPHIMAGQGGVAVEIFSRTCPYHSEYWRLNGMKWNAPDVIIAGLGGGGLVSGMGAVVEEFNEITGNKTKVIGVQSEAADSMYRSVKEGKCLPSTNMNAKTCADGINVKQASQRMINTVRKYVHQVVRVPEESIIESIVHIAEHPELIDKRWHTNEWYDLMIPFRILPGGTHHVHEYRRMNRVEGAAAAPFAAVFYGDLDGELDWRKIADGKKELDVYCVFTGGNIPNDKWVSLINKYGNVFVDGTTMRKRK